MAQGNMIEFEGKFFPAPADYMDMITRNTSKIRFHYSVFHLIYGDYLSWFVHTPMRFLLPAFLLRRCFHTI